MAFSWPKPASGEPYRVAPATAAPPDLPPGPAPGERRQPTGLRRALGVPVRAWRRQPLRVQMVLVVLALVTLGLAITGVAARQVLHSQLMSRVDGQLASSVAGGHFGGPRYVPPPNGGPQLGPSTFFGVYTADGSAVVAPDLRVTAGRSDVAPQLPRL